MKKVSQNGWGGVGDQDRERACKLGKQTGGERRQGRHMLVRGNPAHHPAYGVQT